MIAGKLTSTYNHIVIIEFKLYVETLQKMGFSFCDTVYVYQKVGTGYESISHGASCISKGGLIICLDTKYLLYLYKEINRI